MGKRIKKVNEQVRELVAEAMLEHLSRQYFYTVKAVETTSDMKRAIVWVAVLGDEVGFLDELKLHKNAIQHAVTSKMYAKYTPILEYKIDHSEEYVQRIDELLRGK